MAAPTLSIVETTAERFATTFTFLSDERRSVGLPECTAVALRRASVGGMVVHDAFMALFGALGVPALALYGVLLFGV
jgi:hypothetical protein